MLALSISGFIFLMGYVHQHADSPDMWKHCYIASTDSMAVLDTIQAVNDSHGGMWVCGHSLAHHAFLCFAMKACPP